MDGMNKKIVFPGELLSDNPSFSGPGTYVSGGKVYASVCGLLIQKGKLSVHPFSGPYIPKKNDYILGYVTVVTPSNWIFDIGCPYEGLLHVSEYPIRVPSEEMEKHFDVGDTVLLKVVDVNAEMKIELTYKDPACRKLSKGCLLEVPSSKVSRIIGHSGTMISMLKSKTGCDIFVGSNGRIWMNGSSDDINILIHSLQKIEKDARLSGLTDLMIAFINEQYDLIGLKPHGFVPAAAESSKSAVSQKPAAVEDQKIGTKKARHKKLTKSAEETNADSESVKEFNAKEEADTESVKEDGGEKELEFKSSNEADAEKELEFKSVNESDVEKELEFTSINESGAEKELELKSVKKAALRKDSASGDAKETAGEKVVEKKSKGSRSTKSAAKKESKKSEKIKSGETDEIGETDTALRNNCICFKSVRFTHPHPQE